MKTAEEWWPQIYEGRSNSNHEIHTIKKIQADAINHVVDHYSRHEGTSQDWIRDVMLSEAWELEHGKQT